MVIPKHTRRSGWSLLEAIIAMTLLAIVTVGLGRSLRRSVALYNTTSMDLVLERRFERAVDRLRDEFSNASAFTLDPVPIIVPGGPTPWTGALEYRQVQGWIGGAPQLGPLRRIEARLEDGELDDGIDQDGDGLIDERDLILTTDFGGPAPQERVLAHGVLELFPGETLDGADENANGLEDESGLSVVVENGEVTLRLALGEASPGAATITRSRTFTLSLPN